MKLSAENEKLPERTSINEQAIINIDYKVKNMEGRIRELEEDNVVVARLETILEYTADTQRTMSDHMLEMSRKQATFDQRIQNFDVTLSKVNDNLNLLNASHEVLKVEVTGLKDDVKSTKDHVKEVEKVAEKNSQRGTFDVLNFISNDALKVILLALLGVVLAYFGFK